MAYIDPYNLEYLSFPILETLAINFRTMDLQRNAELEFDPTRARFDDAAPGWRQSPAVLSASRPNAKLLKMFASVTANIPWAAARWPTRPAR